MFKAVRSLCLAGSLWMILNPSATAQEIAVFGPPTTSYEGQRTFVTSEMTLVQKVNSKPGKNRSESNLEGQNVVQIWRDDLQKFWSFSAGEMNVMEVSYNSAQRQKTISGFDDETALIENRLLGIETVNGVVTSHHYIHSTTSGGGSSKGDVWSTPENVVVRMRITQSEPGRAPEKINYDLTNLRYSPQADDLFELPAGSRIVSLDSIDIQTGEDDEKGFAEVLARDAAEEAKQEASRQVRGKVREKAAKTLEEIFKW